MKTKMEYIKEMEQDNVLMHRELTFPEYAEQLTEFQDIVCKMITGDAYHDRMRIDEATFIMESEARKKGLRSEAAVHNGVLTMKRLSKEMAITMSGIKGERLVSRTLEFISRSKCSEMYRFMDEIVKLLWERDEQALNIMKRNMVVSAIEL